MRKKINKLMRDPRSPFLKTEARENKQDVENDQISFGKDGRIAREFLFSLFF